MILGGKREPVIPKDQNEVYLYNPSDRLKDLVGSEREVVPVEGCKGLWKANIRKRA